MVLQLAVIAFVLMIVSLAVSRFEQAALEEQYGLRAQAVAESVAEITEVRRLVAGDHISPKMQATAESIRLRTGVDFVVITDVDGIRHSHPNPERIGARVSTDPGRALAGISDWYVETGTLGPSVRGKVPIWDETGEDVVGIVSVGVLTGEVSDSLRELRSGLLAAAGLAFGAGAIAAYFGARRIRRQTLGLEPPEIAALYEHRDGLLRALHEGVLSLDDDGVVVLANSVATTMLRIDTADLGTRLENRPDLAPLLALGEIPTYQVDVPLDIAGQMLLVTIAPLTIRGRHRGAVYTFRDRTELQGLVSELESAQGLIDALRAQAHEHSNKLHTISGLIELGRLEDVLDIVDDHSMAERAIGDLYNAGSGSDALIVAALLAKAAVAGERNVLLRTHIGELGHTEVRVSRDIVTIVGNLIDNAVDHLTEGRVGGGEIEIGVWSEDGTVRIDVSDSGDGIDPEVLDQIFESGYTTKDRRSHEGLGLVLVKDLVDRYNGTITVDSEAGSGTLFSVTLDLESARYRSRSTPPWLDQARAAVEVDGDDEVKEAAGVNR